MVHQIAESNKGTPKEYQASQDYAMITENVLYCNTIFYFNIATYIVWSTHYAGLTHCAVGYGEYKNNHLDREDVFLGYCRKFELPHTSKSRNSYAINSK